MIQIEQYVGQGISVDRFHAQGGQGWCLLGPNGSGIDALADLLAGYDIEGTWKTCTLAEETGYISFARQQEIYEAELRNDETNFIGRLDPGRPARDFIRSMDQYTDLIAACNMTSAMDTGYKHLSSGQSRKLVLLSEVSKGKACLIMQTPYEGIDQQTRGEFDRLFALLIRQGTLVIVTVHTCEDLPGWATHAGLVQNGILVVQGEVEHVLPDIRHQFQVEKKFTATSKDLEDDKPAGYSEGADRPLVQLRNGFASYGDTTIFSGISLSIYPGQHTLITGPNGCGKSTLIQLITGDHPMCYRNDLQIYGRKRGTGESIWDIKRSMGIVSSELHRSHRIPGSALQVVLSGLFDSIGLYTQPTNEQVALSRRWLARVGMADDARTPFRQLTYGEQRLLLIGRALVKGPRLLILDEPTLGLDHANRMAILDFLAQAAGEGLCTLIYVSHRQDEYRSFFQQHLEMPSLCTH